MSKENDKMKNLISLLKRRGFIWQSSEIYGGAANSYDYGPLGVLVKNNLKNFWLRSMTKSDLNIVPLDSSIFMHPKVWEASGHTENFIDPLVECENCHKRFRKEDIEDKCPSCGTDKFSEPKTFNLMFETNLGPVKESANKVYLRPETAQGIYVDYKLVQQALRLKIPFGIAQIGKAFRNEITPSNFTFRTVEFEQMEQQFFVHSKDAERWFKEWRERRFKWYTDGLGIRKENLRLKEHGKDELAHYAKSAEDIEYQFPFGWHEIEGIHNRGDWDLSRHQEFSGKDLTYFDEDSGEKFIPHIIECSAGADRVMLAMLADAYTEDEKNDRTVLKLNPWFSPYRVAIFPLVKADVKLVDMAQVIYKDLRQQYSVFYDETGSVGRRYRRQDEIGTPWCITVDGQSLEDNTVTVRDRDTLKQERVKAEELENYISKRLSKFVGHYN